MPTPFDPDAGLREIADGIMGEGRFQNFVAQSHSRDVLRQMQIPEADWPAYTPALDEDLAYGAQTLLYIGLRLKLQAITPDSGDVYLTRGAEVLEYIYARSDDSDPERVSQLFTAALAYYMAGHFARAFVLVRDLEAAAPLPRFLRPLRHLLLKEYRSLRVEVLDRLLRGEYEDATIAAAVATGELDEDSALCRVLEATLFRALSHFLEHARTGAPELLSAATSLVEGGVELAQSYRFADWWWYYSCVLVMFSTFKRHSLWTNLGPFLNRPETAGLALRYIRANLRLTTPVTELWPSQVTAVPHLFAESRRNLCIRMPTSAGKTKIAELSILSHLTAGVVEPDFKCVYVAPFRSLAVEIEQTLRPALRPLGLRVSELYGGFELTATDRLIIESTHVLVATPEKFDAFIRFSPELAAQIRLVILDEGHIISPPNLRSLRQARGLKYEVFLQRLVARCQRTAARIVFLSAVMPNADQFAEWITGKPDGLLSSDWRPSRLMMGEAVWDGVKVDIEFTHADRQPLGHKCFVRGFVPSKPAGELPGRKRTHPFPKDSSEALGLTAIELARHKLTMVFIAQKRSAEPFGRTLLKCIKIRRAIAVQAGESYGIAISAVHQAEVDRCVALIQEYMGEESEYVEFLREGFAIHHSSLPQPVRIGVERLVRSGAVRLVVATTTLAQGVNFPIHTVLVHSLDQGHDQPVSPMDFWNICGRAGRGMKENEGQVLFFVKQDFEEWGNSKSPKFKQQPRSWRFKKWQNWCEEQRQFRTSYLTQYGTYQVQSGLLYLLNQVMDLWKEKHSSVDVPQLCEALANHNLDMFAPSESVDLVSLLSTLDGLLLAMTEECESDEITPDTFQDLLCRSLVHLQLATPQERAVVNEIFSSRVRYIRGRYPDQAKRRQFYQLGLPLRDCEFIEEHRQDLLELYLKAADYSTWSIEERAGHISDIADYLFRLSEIAPDNVPVSSRRILELWLSGLTTSGILADAEVSNENLSSHDLNRWIDDVFAFRLPWGLNSVGCYLKQYADSDAKGWPDVCDYFSAFVKYGVNEPVVCWLLAAGVSHRTAAARIGMLIGDRASTPESMLRWLKAGGIEQLVSEGMSESDAEMLKNAVLIRDTRENGENRPLTIRLGRPGSAFRDLAPGTRLLIEPIRDGEPHRYNLLTLSGAIVTTFRLASDTMSRLMTSPEYVTASVVESSKPEDATRLHIRLESF